MAKDKIKALALISLPPPLTGPEVANQALFKGIPDDLMVMRINPPGDNAKRGRLSLSKLTWFVPVWLKYLVNLLRKRPTRVYLAITATNTGWIRDLGLLLPAKAVGSRTVLHMRGGHFGLFFKHAPWVLRVFIKPVVDSSLVIVQSPALKTQFKGFKCKVVVLPNHVEPGWLKIEPGKKQRQILFVGWLTVSKGLDLLADAMTRLWEKHPDVRLVLVGKMPKKQTNVFWDWKTGQRLPKKNTRQILHQLKAKGNVVVIPEITGRGKQELFAESKVFVLPSRSEGMSMSLIEAMASACAVVSSDVGAAVDLIEDGVNGFLFPSGDAASLYQALNKAFEADQELGQRARQRVSGLRLPKIRQALFDLMAGEEDPPGWQSWFAEQHGQP